MELENCSEKENVDGYTLVLEQSKNNLINWYPFENEAKILEISSKEDMIIKDNITNVIDIKELENIDITFDYVLIIDKLKEIYDKFTIISEKLKENGKILLIENNKASIKNISTSKKQKNLYNLKEIEEILNINGYIYRKNYYILQDYKKVNVIFTDKHLPNSETINRNITFYEDDSIITNRENEIYSEIIKLDTNLFKLFVNSYFIECSKKEFIDNGIEFVSYSNIRREEYKIQTIIKEQNVYKTNANNTSKAHIEGIKKNIDIMKQNNINTLDEYTETEIISKYIRNKENFEEYLINMLLDKKIDEAKQIINKFKDELKQKLNITNSDNNVFDKYNIKYNSENIDNLTFVKYGLWDLIFQNAFFIDNQFYFYDQEWFEENMPIEFIIYRAFKYSSEIRNILSTQYIYELIGIKKENITIFDELDEKLQLKIRCENSWKVHSNSNYYTQIIDRIKSEKDQMYKEAVQLLNEKDSKINALEEIDKNRDNEINMLKSNISQKDTKINDLEKLVKEKQDIISQIVNSKSWKITKPLRKLRGLNKGE